MFDCTFLLAAALFVLGLVGLDQIFDYRLPYLGAIATFVLLQWLVARCRGGRPRQPRVGDDWPTSGPIGRRGQPGLIAAFGASGLLAMLNPYQLTESVRQMLGNRKAFGRMPGEPRHSTIGYRLPFDDEWLVYNGGLDAATSHSWHVAAQRYAYDFVVADNAYRRHRGRGASVDDYFCYGRPVRAAADGVCVAVTNDTRTAPFVGYGIMDVRTRSMLGNHVILRHADHEYGFYAHLVPGSVVVAPCDHVPRGTVIGRCGHTGHSAEPHLHFHVQDTADVCDGAGIPIRFVDITVDRRSMAEAMLRVGDRVAPS